MGHISKTWLLAALTVFGLCLTACGPQTEQAASISGRVYFDEDASEECEECECGIPDVRIKLYEASCGGESFQLIRTNEDGYFLFSDLAPGAYCVYSDLSPTCNGYMPTTSISYAVELQSGEALELPGFGYDLFVDQMQK